MLTRITFLLARFAVFLEKQIAQGKAIEKGLKVMKAREKYRLAQEAERVDRLLNPDKYREKS